MDSDSLRGVLLQFMERPLPTCLPRELVVPTGTRKVVGLAGVRRSGKTFLLLDTIRRLVDQGVDRRSIVYLNFEDDRLQPVAANELDLVLRCVRELHPEGRTGRCYLFLDEVQNVPGWQRWVRRIHDTEDVEIYVTGSSSSLLSRELISGLRGRSITLEVFPLSFREYLGFRGIPFEQLSPDGESRVRAAVESYLVWGGLPEIVLANEALRPLILEEYTALMLYRDVLERYRVHNEKLMRELLRHCFRHTGSLLNVSKLHRDFRSLGFSLSKNTLFEYLSYLEDAFLIFLLPKNDRSLRKQAHNPKKIHVIDTGLVSGFSANRQDLGHRLETAVYLHGRRRSKHWHYDANGGDVDLCDPDGATFVNSCWSLTELDTVQRESAAMEFGAHRWPRATGHLVYHEHAPALVARLPGVVPAWKYLLG